MRLSSSGCLLFLAAAAAPAQTPAAESQVTQTLLSEIRQLRSDLQLTAATIQRVQIVMYRMQAQANALDRASQRFDQARAASNDAQSQQRMLAQQIEVWEGQRRAAQDAAQGKTAEQMLESLKAHTEALAAQEQERQAEQTEAETQLRAEQAKMNDLQEQLDKLDRLLSGFGAK